MQLYRLLGGLSLGLLASIALACGDGEGDGDGSGGSCVPGQQVGCACPGGPDGVQVCAPDGSFFGACMCGDPTGGEETDGMGSDTEIDSDSASGTGDGLCGNGVEDPGECDTAQASYCAQDCSSVDDTAGESDSTGADSCANEPIYVASVPTMGSRWESGALIGFAAGQELCRQAAMGVGAPDPMQVSVCDYDQVVQAELAGEFAAIPAGTTAWLHRTTVADVMGVPSAPGTGGRCVDWTYQTNHISDGEYVEFPGGGAVSYFLDGDTFYDGVDGSHTQPGMLECGTQMRAILCCNPPCMPEG